MSIPCPHGDRLQAPGGEGRSRTHRGHQGGGIRAKDGVSSSTWTAASTDNEAQWWRLRSLAMETFPLMKDSHPSLMPQDTPSPSANSSTCSGRRAPTPPVVQPLSSRRRVTFQGACAKWSRCREEQPRLLGPGKCLAHSLVSLLFQLKGLYLTCL